MVTKLTAMIGDLNIQGEVDKSTRQTVAQLLGRCGQGTYITLIVVYPRLQSHNVSQDLKCEAHKPREMTSS